MKKMFHCEVRLFFTDEDNEEIFPGLLKRELGKIYIKGQTDSMDYDFVNASKMTKEEIDNAFIDNVVEDLSIIFRNTLKTYLLVHKGFGI